MKAKTLISVLIAIVTIIFSSCESKEKLVEVANKNSESILTDTLSSTLFASDSTVNIIVYWCPDTSKAYKVMADTSRVKDAHPLPIMLHDFSSSISDYYILHGREYASTNTNTGFLPIMLLLIIFLLNSSNSSRRRH